MSVPDELTRTIVTGASRERVWAALTEPEHLIRWFPTHEAVMDLRTGGAVRFAWEDMADEGVVDVVEPLERLVFRWRPEAGDRPYTTVSITLEDVPEGTRVTLVESGFAALPDRVAGTAHESHRAGWTSELEELRTFLGSERATA